MPHRADDDEKDTDPRPDGDNLVDVVFQAHLVREMTETDPVLR